MDSKTYAKCFFDGVNAVKYELKFTDGLNFLLHKQVDAEVVTEYKRLCKEAEDEKEMDIKHADTPTKLQAAQKAFIDAEVDWIVEFLDQQYDSCEQNWLELEEEAGDVVDSKLRIRIMKEVASRIKDVLEKRSEETPINWRDNQWILN